MRTLQFLTPVSTITLAEAPRWLGPSLSGRNLGRRGLKAHMKPRYRRIRAKTRTQPSMIYAFIRRGVDEYLLIQVAYPKEPAREPVVLPDRVRRPGGERKALNAAHEMRKTG